MSNPQDPSNSSAEPASEDVLPDAPQPATEVNAPASGPAEVHPAEFPEATRRRSGARSSLERFSDVRVAISVEIGRVTMSIGEMLQLGEGSVVELDRELTEPVAVMAQGVRIARGEVVVINDRFAVRITEIADTMDGGSAGLMEGAA
ncbi:MAG: flagellar motor switch protein FliN [Fuerstiella sp.]